MRNNNLQNIKQKTKVRETRTPRQIEGELGYSKMDNSSCSTCDIHCVTFYDTNHIWYENISGRQYMWRLSYNVNKT